MDENEIAKLAAELRSLPDAELVAACTPKTSKPREIPPEQSDKVYLLLKMAHAEMGGLALTAAQVSEASGIPRPQTARVLEFLIETGKVTQIGKARGTKYACAQG